MENEVKVKKLIANDFMGSCADIFGEYKDKLTEYLENESPIHQNVFNYLCDHKYFSKEVEDVNFYEEENNELKQCISYIIADNNISSQELSFSSYPELDTWVNDTNKFYIEKDTCESLSNSGADSIVNSNIETIRDKDKDKDLRKRKNAYSYVKRNGIITNIIENSINMINGNPVVTVMIELKEKNKDGFYIGTKKEIQYDTNGTINNIEESKVIYIETVENELICIDEHYVSHNEYDEMKYQSYINPTYEKIDENTFKVTYSRGPLNETATIFSKEVYELVDGKARIKSYESEEDGETISYGYNEEKFIDIADKNMKSKMGYVTTYKKLINGKSVYVGGETNKFSIDQFGFGTSNGTIIFNKGSFMKSVYRSNLLGKIFSVFNKIRFISIIDNETEDVEDFSYEYDEYGALCSGLREYEDQSTNLVEYNRVSIDDNYELIESFAKVSPLEKDDSFFYNIIIGNKESKRIEYNYQALIVPQ